MPKLNSHKYFIIISLIFVLILTDTNILIAKDKKQSVHFKEGKELFIEESCQLHLLNKDNKDISDKAYWYSDKNSIVSKTGFVQMINVTESNENYIETTVTAIYKNKKYRIKIYQATLFYVSKRNIDFSRYIEDSDPSKNFYILETSDGEIFGFSKNNYRKNTRLKKKHYVLMNYINTDDIKRILAQIKLEYPDGSIWDLNTSYTSKLGKTSAACRGFIDMILDKSSNITLPQFSNMRNAYKNNIEEWGNFDIRKINEPSDLKLYDIVSYTTSDSDRGHMLMITGFSIDGVIVTEGNHNEKVCWGCFTPYETLFSNNDCYAISILSDNWKDNDT